MGNKEGKPKADKPQKGDGAKPDKPKKAKKTKPIQCVVLGIAASGKSTFTRQLRVIHGIAFTPTELDNIKNIIRGNVVSGLHEVTQLAARRDLELQEVNIKHARYLETLTKETNFNEVWKEDKFVAKLESLWSDPSVQTTWATSDATLSNLAYFMKKVETIATDAYVPDHDDVFRARQRTAGAATTEFVVAKQAWSFKDAGGQPYERKLWPDIIASALHAIMFFVALDEYDSPSDAEPNQTKMEDSLAAWKDLFELPSVKTSCVLLFLNKVDLFTQKWEKDPTSFKKIFEKGASATNVDEAVQVVGEHYVTSIAEEFQAPGKIYIAPVTALDTGLVTTVFNQVRIHVIKSRMAGAGMRI